MADVLRFETARTGRRPQVQASRHDAEPDDFWPEVSSGLWATQPPPADPANSPGRVLGEMGLILGVAALLVLLVTFFMGGAP